MHPESFSKSKQDLDFDANIDFKQVLTKDLRLDDPVLLLPSLSNNIAWPNVRPLLGIRVVQPFPRIVELRFSDIIINVPGDTQLYVIP